MSATRAQSGRGLELLAVLFDARRPLDVATIAHAVGGTRSGVHRLLRRLEALAFVTRDADGRWCLPGSGVTTIPAALVARLGLRAAARPVLQRIEAATGETVTLNVHNRGHRMRVDTLEGRPPVTVMPPGETLPLHVGAGGKVILAYLPPAQAEPVLARAQAEGHDADRLREELSAIRRRGYIAAVGDRLADVGVLSVPVFGAGGLAASLSVVGPVSRWDRPQMEHAAARVRVECTRLSAALGASSLPE